MSECGPMLADGIAIAEAARALDERRRAWLNPPDASAAGLNKRTLTNLYNARPAWLANLHSALDRAVWDAYGWDDPDPAAVADDAILARLLALSGERARATQHDLTEHSRRGNNASPPGVLGTSALRPTGAPAPAVDRPTRSSANT